MARRKRKGRAVNGVLLLDKPQGISSNQALQMVKRLYGAAKAGHTGSLDPLATGMLPICFGEATKISGFLLDADKTYRLSCQLGVTTTTGDADGEVLATRDAGAVTQADIEPVLNSFLGCIEQIPPMYSALKHEGQRLYKLAREGIEVERKPRRVQIHTIVLHNYSAADRVLDIEVSCSKGTYVRTLAEDIGAKLEVGAHVVQLRRLRVGLYETEMVTLDELNTLSNQGTTELDRLLLAIDSGVADWPHVRLAADAAHYMNQGQPILVPHAPTRGWARIYDEHRFMGLGEIQDDGRVAPRRMLQQGG